MNTKNLSLRSARCPQNEWSTMVMDRRKCFKSLLRRKKALQNFKSRDEVYFLPPDSPSPQIKKSLMFPSLTGSSQAKHCMYMHLYFQKERYHYISFKILLEVVQRSILRPVAVHDTKIVCHALKMYSFSFWKSVFMQIQFLPKKENHVAFFHWNITSIPRCHSSHE